jgi:hypothetical protein
MLTRLRIAMIMIALALGILPAEGASELQMIWRVQKVGQLPPEDKSCFVASLGNDIVARLSRDTGDDELSWSIFVGYDNSPNSLRYLRVGREIYVTDEEFFRGPEAEEIVLLLKNPGEFSFEWARNPDYAKQQGLFGTGDFAAKAAACADWMSRDRI